MKFGDVVLPVASMAVIFALIASPLEIALFEALGISGMNNWGYLVSLIVSLFLGALISGCIFARRIWEARREAITKIAVLWAALVMLFALTVPGALADWGATAKEEFLAMNPGTTLSTAEWLTWEYMYVDMFAFMMVGMALLLGLSGLYVGSMLRKPAQNQK